VQLLLRRLMQAMESVDSVQVVESVQVFAT